MKDSMTKVVLLKESFILGGVFTVSEVSSIIMMVGNMVLVACREVPES